MRTVVARLVAIAGILSLGWAAVALTRDKPIEIRHLPRYYVTVPAVIVFEVRLHPQPDDRHVSAFVCDLTWDRCGLGKDDHDLGDSHDIEGEREPKLWQPKPFLLWPGEFAVVAAIGPKDQIRAIKVVGDDAE